MAVIVLMWRYKTANKKMIFFIKNQKEQKNQRRFIFARTLQMGFTTRIATRLDLFVHARFY
jgi:hypothetical protein